MANTNVVHTADDDCAQFAVPGAMASACNAVSDLEQSLGCLRKRLEPVISIRPDNMKKGELKGSPSVPLAGEIDALRDRIRDANEDIVELLDRLHV